MFGCLKTSRGIFFTFNILVPISNLGYFCSRNYLFQFFEAFFFFHIFIFNNDAMTHILARENGIYVKKCRSCLNGTYLIEFGGLL